MLYENDVLKSSNGVPQGAILSPLLFNIVIDHLIRDITSANIFISAYADDTLAIVYKQREFNVVIENLNSFSRLANLNWNKDKTEVIAIEWKDINTHGIKLVTQYKYLGTVLYNTLRSVDRRLSIKTRITKYIGWLVQSANIRASTDSKENAYMFIHQKCI